MLEDTIIAISTPPGFGGLGIVRISGRKALEVAGRIFEPRARSKRPFPERRLVFGTIRDPERKEALDEAFLTYFKAPRSYTREDVVELSAHGSPAVLEGILRMILNYIQPFELEISSADPNSLVRIARLAQANGPSLPAMFQHCFSLIYRVLDRKYGFDEFYSWLFAGGAHAVRSVVEAHVAGSERVAPGLDALGHALQQEEDGQGRERRIAGGPQAANDR